MVSHGLELQQGTEEENDNERWSVIIPSMKDEYEHILDTEQMSSSRFDVAALCQELLYPRLRRAVHPPAQRVC